MLTNPSRHQNPCWLSVVGVLLTDEPTTGLDSFTAHTIMETLLHLAKEGRTVVATIHQPRSDIFELFDLVILLSKGDVVYFGHAKRMIEYFGSLNYECPLLANPADYFGTDGNWSSTYLAMSVDLASVDGRNPDAEAKSTKRIGALVKNYRSINWQNLLEDVKSDSDSNLHPIEEFAEEGKINADFRDAASVWKAAPLLSRRAYQNSYRHSSAVTRFSQAISLSFVIAVCWLRLGSDQTSISDRIGLLYTCMGLNFVG